MALIELSFMGLIIYLWVKKGVPNSKVYFWITMLESFCIFNYVMFAMVSVFSQRGDINPKSKGKAIYEVVVLVLFLLIVISQIL